VSDPCTVLIATAELLPKMKQRVAEAAANIELLAFTDVEALRALEAITKRRPAIVALERMFAATPRGAALINRIKADPNLVEMEIRVVSHDLEFSSVTRKGAQADGGPAAGGTATATAAPSVAAPAAAPGLDQRGTRRAPRFKIAPNVEILVDGNPATLIDISTVGAQVVTAVVLKPNQRIRMALTDGSGAVRFNASVAWAKFEIPPGSGPRYRAGVEFIEPNAKAIEAYYQRHKA
jgi:PilZ domain-containing protein